MLLGILVLIVAMIISSISGFVSILGMSAIFPGGGVIIIAMMSALEIGKLVTTGWLHHNWSNAKVNRRLRYPLTAIIILLMALTSLGLYGFLSKSHLEQETPLASVELKIAQIQQQIDQTNINKARTIEQQKQLDQSLSLFVTTSKTTKDAKNVAKAQIAQNKQRDLLQVELKKDDDVINKLTNDLIPLKLQISDVAAKLGPLKFVGKLFGWQDSETAVQMVIVMIMSAFDPLAILLVIAATISLSEKRKLKIEKHDEFAPTSPIPVMNFDEFASTSVVKDIKENEEFSDTLATTHQHIVDQLEVEDIKNIALENHPVPESKMEETKEPEKTHDESKDEIINELNKDAPKSASQEWLKEPWFKPSN